MEKSNFILIPIGIIVFIVGVILNNTYHLFNDSESMGHLGFLLTILGIFLILLQGVIIILKILWLKIM